MPDHISYSEFQNEWISSTDVKQFNHIATTVDSKEAFKRYGDTNVYYVKCGYMYSKHYLETMLNENITNDVAINRGYRVYYDSGTFIGRIREVA